MARTGSRLEAAGRGGRRAVALWLFFCCAAIFAMVVLGGITRLTQSGLSMVDWHPLMGILPPFGETAWRQVFAAYRRFPEYQQLNPGMTLDAFKSIFWMEYAHRLLGRAIGVVFLVPFVYFAITRRITGALAWKLGVVFLLGALQGLLGWYMVKSGLLNDPDVSPYRLTAHLGLAVAIYGAIFRIALGQLDPPARRSGRPPARGLRVLSGVLVGLVFLTLLSGGFVAGNDAGLAYNTFPLMDGRLVPRDYFLIEPLWRNLFENVPAVQFDHRLLAVATVATAVLLWGLARHARAERAAAVHLLLAAALIQGALGVSTLLAVVPIPLAAAHQAGALALFTAALWVNRAFRRSSPDRRRARSRSRRDRATAGGSARR